MYGYRTDCRRHTDQEGVCLAIGQPDIAAQIGSGEAVFECSTDNVSRATELTRRQGETLIIELPTGEQIQVTVSSIKGNQVRISTDAPADMAIVRAGPREELLEKA